jgi:hypothetical protein
VYWDGNYEYCSQVSTGKVNHAWCLTFVFFYIPYQFNTYMLANLTPSKSKMALISYTLTPTDRPDSFYFYILTPPEPRCVFTPYVFFDQILTGF